MLDLDCEQCGSARITSRPFPSACPSCAYAECTLKGAAQVWGLPRILSCVGTCTFRRAYSPPLAPRAYAQPRLGAGLRLEKVAGQAPPRQHFFLADIIWWTVFFRFCLWEYTCRLIFLMKVT
uniref:Uncharacterized protein n=1 Tax=Knipowitschia caucasica TaxID=637954 RepID=A0AAV2LH22_KNICA